MCTSVRMNGKKQLQEATFIYFSLMGCGVKLATQQALYFTDCVCFKATHCEKKNTTDFKELK
eukprot:m.300859 g.300859  ORF g.300859 m.300859 type:complete len:62 (+) comp16422_c0_seq29:244-429(+)